MKQFFCGACDSWHSRFDPETEEDRFETWRGSLPSILIVCDGPDTPVSVIKTDTLEPLR